MNSPKMKRKHDCGITAIAWVIHKMTTIPHYTCYNSVSLSLLSIRGSSIQDGFILDLIDNPSEHEFIIERLGYKFSLVEPIKENLFNNHCPPFRTIILIHKIDNNVNDLENFINGTFLQHWVVLNSVTDTHISVFMGDGKDAVYYDKDTFEKMIITGTPQCVYVIGDYKNAINTPIYSKFYNHIIRLLMCIYVKFKTLFSR